METGDGERGGTGERLSVEDEFNSEELVFNIILLCFLESVLGETHIAS